MTGNFTTPERVPENAVARLVKHAAGAASTLEALLQSESMSAATATRLHRAYTLLSGVETDVRTGAAQFAAGTREPLLSLAATLRTLALQMDGYELPEKESSDFLVQRQLLVLTAWQIAACASGSEAAGL